jgi:hypothetical protein
MAAPAHRLVIDLAYSARQELGWQAQQTQC